MDKRDSRYDSEGPELDQRFEKLIALLYEELPPEQAVALKREIESDPALRAQWEELQGTRSILSKWDIAEPAPGFVFMQDPSRARPAAVRAVSRRPGPRAWLRRLLPVWTWGLAAAAAVVAVLALSHFRIEQVPGGIAFRIGAEQPRLTAERELLASGALNRPDPRVQAGDRFEMTTSSSGVPLEGLSHALPVSSTMNAANGPNAPAGSSNTVEFLTQEEFHAYVAGMTRTMVALFNEYGDQRDRQMTAFVEAALGQMARQHSQDYQDLSGRIETVGLGLAREQYDIGTRLDLLTKEEGPVRKGPADESRKSDAEGEKP